MYIRELDITQFTRFPLDIWWLLEKLVGNKNNDQKKLWHVGGSS